MPLSIVGIDEAGYGPLLGPLCVGCACVEIERWSEGDPAPDVWALLKSGVCTKPNDKRRRVAIADSKRLKLPNDGLSHHPLTHLERGVLAMLAVGDCQPRSDRALLEALGATCPRQAWYQDAPDAPLAFPVAHASEEIMIAGNTLRRAMFNAGVRVTRLACEVVCEATFNRIVRDEGSKGEATAHAIGLHLRRVWGEAHASPTGAPSPGEVVPPRVVIDRQGGRTQYGAWLAALLPESIGAGSVVVLEEGAERSRYDVLTSDGRRGLAVHLQVEAEQHALSVALASMIAKYVRELLMARFNRYWCKRAALAGREVKPTAGYRSDAWRWLKDMEAVLSSDERDAMMRVA